MKKQMNDYESDDDRRQGDGRRGAGPGCVGADREVAVTMQENYRVFVDNSPKDSDPKSEWVYFDLGTSTRNDSTVSVSVGFRFRPASERLLFGDALSNSSPWEVAYRVFAFGVQGRRGSRTFFVDSLADVMRFLYEQEVTQDGVTYRYDLDGVYPDLLRVTPENRVSFASDFVLASAVAVGPRENS